MAQVRTGNRRLMRDLNTSLVLNLVRSTDGVSQVDITQRTQLSSGTVTSIVRELKERNFVKEVGQASAAVGRKPTLLRFNPAAGHVIGASFLADETHVAVLDLAGGIEGQVTFPTRPGRGHGEVFSVFATCATDLLKDTGIHRNKVMGVGVSFEGMVDPVKGTLVLCSRFGWRNVPVKDCVEQQLGLPAFVDSDGCTMAMGEHRYGAGRGAKDIVCLDIDAGIGVAAIVDGRVRRGAHSMFGEIGHTLMVPEGPTCVCGKRGCLETVGSGAAIVAGAREAMAQGRSSTISRQVNSDSMRQAVAAVFDAARAGDELALEVVTRAGNYLALATAGVINYADPELVVLTGCVVEESGGMILDIIRRQTPEQVLDSEYRTIRIEQGTLGKAAPLLGAAAMVYEDAFEFGPLQG